MDIREEIALMVVIGDYRSKADLRKEQRKAISAHAAILMEGDSPPLMCKMSDVSHSGARLVIESDREVPERFKLVLSARGDVWRQCQVAWRSGKELGVQFMRDDKPLGTAPVARKS